MTVRIIGLVLAVHLVLGAGLSIENSNNEQGLHRISSSVVLTHSLSRSPNSESTEQLSGDGHDEAIDLSNVNSRPQWEGTFDMVASGVTSQQKIEAFWAVLAALITAIVSNMMTRATVHHFDPHRLT